MRGQGTQRETDSKTLMDMRRGKGREQGTERGRDIHRQTGGEVGREEKGHIERQTGREVGCGRHTGTNKQGKRWERGRDGEAKRTDIL